MLATLLWDSQDFYIIKPSYLDHNVDGSRYPRYPTKRVHTCWKSCDQTREWSFTLTALHQRYSESQCFASVFTIQTIERISIDLRELLSVHGPRWRMILNVIILLKPIPQGNSTIFMAESNLKRHHPDKIYSSWHLNGTPISSLQPTAISLRSQISLQSIFRVTRFRISVQIPCS